MKEVAMKRIFGILALLISFAYVARADRAAAQQADLSTPKKALKYFDAVGTDPKVDRATLFYHAKTDDEKKVAKAFAAVDLQLAKLRKAAVSRWDRAAGDAMVHAVRDVTAEDIDAATEKIDGDKATMTGKGFSEPLPMIRVNGTWKISLADAIEKAQTGADDLVELCDDLVEAMQLTEQEMLADKYANPSLLQRAMMRRVKAIVGGE
jgi:hypothetical protein